MSSNVTHGCYIGKLVICIAENGHSFELGCAESTIVEAIQECIEEKVGIKLSDQLLLYGDMKLESDVELGTYKLPSVGQEVFCFNRARLRANTAPPLPEKVEIKEIPDPPSPSSNHAPHPLDKSMDPALKALSAYERQFGYHSECGKVIYKRTMVKFETCQRLLREQKVQERAIEIAWSSVAYYLRILNQTFTDFTRCYSQQYRVHSDLLVNYNRDIEKLRSCRLMPALQTSSRKCLFDLVKNESLRKSMEDCASSHKTLENTVSEFNNDFGKLKHDIEDIYSSKALLPISGLESMVKEHYSHLNEQKSIVQSLSKDVSTVTKLVHDYLASQLSSSLRPHDAVSALSPMYDVHVKNHLPKMVTCDSSISGLLDYCANKKNEMNRFVHNYMQKIAYIQRTIKDDRRRFNGFSEALKRKDALFDGLRVVRYMGPAYRACLAEVVRRKASMKLYMGMAGQLAEKLAVKRKEEVRRREDFLKVQTHYIPTEILAAMGLFDNPSQCDVNLVPFDTNLLDINIVDIDRFAPESLVGQSFKAVKQGTSVTSLSLPNENSHSSDAEVNSEKIESQDIFDGSEFIEIAGTSKMEVENAKLRSELASAISHICFMIPEVEYGSFDDDDNKFDNVLKNAAEKTVVALQQKDEYIRHLESLIKAKQLQCQSYEKRIEELGQHLSHQYMHRRKSETKEDDCQSEISDHVDGQLSSKPRDMDVNLCASNPADAKDGLMLSGKAQEGVDDNMTDSSGMLHPHLDSSVMDPQRDEQKLEDKEEDKGLVNVLAPEVPVERIQNANSNPDLLPQLQSRLGDKANQLSETESRLMSALDEIERLGSDLEISRKLLDESQMNCAHLDNRLHEVRQEAQTHLCAADRRASEYDTLRASSVKMHGLSERLRSCIIAATGVGSFADSLRSLAQSVASSSSYTEEDGTAVLRAVIRLLADKVGIMARQRAALLDRHSKAEIANKQLTKEFEEKKELVDTLSTKHQLEKQVNKEKISVNRFEVHELAAFVLNSSGQYEAISRNCPNYYLSSESVSLFTDHLPTQPAYVIGQIVHVERQVVKEPPAGSRAPYNAVSNPFGLPMGCEYSIVTVAMLPDTTIHLTPPS